MHDGIPPGLVLVAIDSANRVVAIASPNSRSRFLTFTVMDRQPCPCRWRRAITNQICRRNSVAIARAGRRLRRPGRSGPSAGRGCRFHEERRGVPLQRDRMAIRRDALPQGARPPPRPGCIDRSVRDRMRPSARRLLDRVEGRQVASNGVVPHGSIRAASSRRAMVGRQRRKRLDLAADGKQRTRSSGRSSPSRRWTAVAAPASRAAEAEAAVEATARTAGCCPP
jgi:hypothetical protein